MSDAELPPPGVHPAAWTRWQERRGQTPPLPARPTPAAPARADDEPLPTDDGPSAADDEPSAARGERGRRPTDWPGALAELRSRVEAAPTGGPAAEQVAVGRAELAALLARLERLEGALRTYGQHALHCAARGGGARCDCGLAAELAWSG